MMKDVERRLTLDRPVTYQIKVPGKIDESQTYLTTGLKVAIESDGHDLPATTLTGEFDKAALHGLLRRLYSLGLPLISVLWIESGLGNQV